MENEGVSSSMWPHSSVVRTQLADNSEDVATCNGSEVFPTPPEHTASYGTADSCATSCTTCWSDGCRFESYPESQRELARTSSEVRVVLSLGSQEMQKPAEAGFEFLAPRVGFEPTTLRLTAGCSAVELPRNSLRFSVCARKYYSETSAQCKCICCGEIPGKTSGALAISECPAIASIRASI